MLVLCGVGFAESCWAAAVAGMCAQLWAGTSSARVLELQSKALPHILLLQVFGGFGVLVIASASAQIEDDPSRLVGESSMKTV